MFKKDDGKATGVSRPPSPEMYVCNIFLEGDLGSLTVRTTREPFSILGGKDTAGVVG